MRDALDAIAAAREANGPSNGRHHLAHLQIVTEADTQRFAKVDAVANLQMLWATHEDQIDTLTLPFMQEGAEDRQYPFGDLVRGGARLAAGSDWPVSSADPLAAYTSGSAFVNHRDHDTGHIRDGYLANLVVIEPNPFTMPSDELYRASVASTWIEGVNVYTRPES